MNVPLNDPSLLQSLTTAGPENGGEIQVEKSGAAQSYRGGQASEKQAAIPVIAQLKVCWIGTREPAAIPSSGFIFANAQGDANLEVVAPNVARVTCPPDAGALVGFRTTADRRSGQRRQARKDDGSKPSQSDRRQSAR